MQLAYMLCFGVFDHKLLLSYVFTQDFCRPSEEPTWQRKSALCTFNLHSCICWLPKQVADRGLTAFNLELWVERFLGWLTTRTKFRLHGRPELIVVKTYLFGCALQAFRWKLLLQHQQQQQQQHSAAGDDAGISPRALITSMEQLRQAVITQQQQRDSSGSSDNYDGSKGEWGHLLGKGRPLQQQQWGELQQSVRRCLKANGIWQPSWDRQWPNVSVWQHSQACLSTGLVLNSTAYNASRSRDGTHFLVFFEQGQGTTATTTAQAAQAKFFLRIRDPINSSSTIRLAVADLCDLRPSVPDPDLSDIVLEGRRGVFKQASYPVLLESIEAPCALHDRRVTEADGSKVMWRRYLPIDSSSRRLRQRGLREVTTEGSSGSGKHGDSS